MWEREKLVAPRLRSASAERILRKQSGGSEQEAHEDPRPSERGKKPTGLKPVGRTVNGDETLVVTEEKTNSSSRVYVESTHCPEFI